MTMFKMCGIIGSKKIEKLLSDGSQGEILYKLIDLSHTIDDNMPVYPGDIRTNLFQTNYLSSNKFNSHRLEMSMHSGTHIDSPMHLTKSKEYISEIELDSFFAAGCVLDVRNQSVIEMKAEYESLIEANSIVLFYTGLDKIYGSKEYYEDYPVIEQELAAFLIKKNIKMIGIDTPSPDKYPFLIHKLLLKTIYLLWRI